MLSTTAARLLAGSVILTNWNTPISTILRFSGGSDYQSYILADTSRDPDVFNDDDEGTHVITDGCGLLANGTEVESESYHFFRALDADSNPTGDVITVTVFSQTSQTSNIWGMASDTLLREGVRYQKIGGSNKGESLCETCVPYFTRMPWQRPQRLDQGPRPAHR